MIPCDVSVLTFLAALSYGCKMVKWTEAGEDEVGHSCSVVAAKLGKGLKVLTGLCD